MSPGCQCLDREDTFALGVYPKIDFGCDMCIPAHRQNPFLVLESFAFVCFLVSKPQAWKAPDRGVRKIQLGEGRGDGHSTAGEKLVHPFTVCKNMESPWIPR